MWWLRKLTKISIGNFKRERQQCRNYFEWFMIFGWKIDTLAPKLHGIYAYIVPSANTSLKAQHCFCAQINRKDIYLFYRIFQHRWCFRHHPSAHYDQAEKLDSVHFENRNIFILLKARAPLRSLLKSLCTLSCAAAFTAMFSLQITFWIRRILHLSYFRHQLQQRVPQ